MRGSGKPFRDFLHISALLLLSFSLAAQELVLVDGLYEEKPVLGNKDDHAYSKDNISYKTDMLFVFDYYFLGPSSSEKKKFVYDPESHGQSFELSDYDHPSKNAIDKIRMTITDELSNVSFDSAYNQTVFSYDYLNALGAGLSLETTGIIDNRKNLWLRPPRSDQFAILEINPFPLQNLDENIKSWDWNLEVGSRWSDPRWKSWKEEITIRHKYQRMKDENLQTKMGLIKCKVVQATGTFEIEGELNKTYLKSWYHPDFGFVQLEYTNINGTKLVMELIEVKKPAPENPDRKLLAEYNQNCCVKYFTETLRLYNDSSFEYKYAEKTQKNKHRGKWKKDQDTLLLYDYVYPPITDTPLEGDESVIALKDSVEIIFKEAGSKNHTWIPFTINGRCFQPNINDRYAVAPGGTVSFITVGSGKYFVKNKSSNKFLVYFDPDLRFQPAPRVRNISKCLVTEKYIAKINCDGQLNGAYKLDKK